MTPIGLLQCVSDSSKQNLSTGQTSRHSRRVWVGVTGVSANTFTVGWVEKRVLVLFGRMIFDINKASVHLFVFLPTKQKTKNGLRLTKVIPVIMLCTLYIFVYVCLCVNIHRPHIKSLWYVK